MGITDRDGHRGPGTSGCGVSPQTPIPRGGGVNRAPVLAGQSIPGGTPSPLGRPDPDRGGRGVLCLVLPGSCADACEDCGMVHVQVSPCVRSGPWGPPRVVCVCPPPGNPHRAEDGTRVTGLDAGPVAVRGQRYRTGLHGCLSVRPSVCPSVHTPSRLLPDSLEGSAHKCHECQVLSPDRQRSSDPRSIPLPNEGCEGPDPRPGSLPVCPRCPSASDSTSCHLCLWPPPVPLSQPPWPPGTAVRHRGGMGGNRGASCHVSA